LASQFPTTAASKRQADTTASDTTALASEQSTDNDKSVDRPADGSPARCHSPCNRTGNDARARGEGNTTGSDSKETAQGWAWNFDTACVCPECGAQEHTRSESGEWYCKECGVVQTRGDVEQQDPGWVSEKDRRSGPSTGPSEIQVGSSVGTPWSNEGGRWAQYNDRLSYENKRLLDSLKEIRALTTSLELTDATQDDAAVLFRKTANEGLLQGRSIEGTAAACVYIAARRNEQPLTFSWLADVSPVEESEISSTYRNLLSAFDLKMKTPVPGEFVDRIGSDAGLPISIRSRAQEILAAVTEAGEHIGQSPPGMAAAALYGAAMESEFDITQERIAEPAGVSVVTLSRQWQTIKSVIE